MSEPAGVHALLLDEIVTRQDVQERALAAGCRHHAHVHDDGHTSVLTPAGARHRSTRSASLPRRIWKRVCFPIPPRLETRISRVTPKRRERSNRRNSTGATPRLLDTATRPANRIGQPRPLHPTVIRALSVTCLPLITLS